MLCGAAASHGHKHLVAKCIIIFWFITSPPSSSSPAAALCQQPQRCTQWCEINNSNMYLADSVWNEPEMESEHFKILLFSCHLIVMPVQGHLTFFFSIPCIRDIGNFRFSVTRGTFWRQAGKTRSFWFERLLLDIYLLLEGILIVAV